MLPQAIAPDEQILDNEAELELAFRSGEIDETFLRDQLDLTKGLKAELRFVHLRTHISTVEILTPYQIQLYNSLRGYTMPSEGHDSHQGH